MGLTILDAGVVIAAFDATDAHHAAAGRELGTARDRGDALALPASAYAEVLVRPAARSSSTLTRVDSLLDALPVTVIDATRDIARRAARLRARHPALRLPDALVIATAIESGADHLLTTDVRWPQRRSLGLRARLVVVT